MLRSVLPLGAAVVFMVGCSVSVTGPSGEHSTAKKPSAQKHRLAAEPSAAEEPAAASKDLGELPPVDQVVKDLRVPSTRETASRSYVALNTLSFLASASDDRAKASEYSVAATATMKAELAKYDSTCKGNHCDEHFFTLCRNAVYHNDSFQGEIANRYLTPARRSFLVAKYNKPCHRMPCLRISYLDHAASTPFEPKGELAKAVCSDDSAAGATAIDHFTRGPQLHAKLQGSYVGSDGVAFEIGRETAQINCKRFKVASVSYKIVQRDPDVLVIFEVGSYKMQFTMGDDRRLIGKGRVQVSGQVAAGSDTVFVPGQIVAVGSQTAFVPGQSVTVDHYATASDTCVFDGLNRVDR